MQAVFDFSFVNLLVVSVTIVLAASERGLLLKKFKFLLEWVFQYVGTMKL